MFGRFTSTLESLLELMVMAVVFELLTARDFFFETPISSFPLTVLDWFWVDWTCLRTWVPGIVAKLAF